MTGAATAKQQMTAVELWLAIESRVISLTPICGGSIWMASIDRVKTQKPFSRPVLEVVSAQGRTAFGAVESLCAKLNREEMGMAA